MWGRSNDNHLESKGFILRGFSHSFSPSIQDGEKEREKRDERIRSILKGDIF